MVFRIAILASMVFLSACYERKAHSICDVDRLPVDQSYTFTRVAIYSDGNTTLAFDHNDPQCEPVAFEASSAGDMQPIWEITSQSTRNSTIGAVGNVTAKLEKFGPSAVRLKFVGVDKWEPLSIDAQLQAVDAGMPKPSGPS